ncbi:MAG: hypothetical protein E6R13_09620 [Spirochaetes bacterium]|nr:MAG: hypothetical protein E6R13_09620 [Spirochaetota bacterium]
MDRPTFDQIVERRLDLIRKVLVSKGKEYSTDHDVFHNFRAATGVSFHDAPEKVAWEFMTKHLQSIKDILNHVETGGFNGHPSEALVEEKIGDAVNYLILIEGMLKERIKNENKST